MQIYVHRDGEQFGPYSVEQTRDYLASGNLSVDDLAWHEGAADWAPLAQMAGLAPAAPTPVAGLGQAGRKAWIPSRRDGAVSTAVEAPVGVDSGASAEPRRTGSRSTVRRTTRRSSSGFNEMRRRRREIGARNMGVGAVIFVVGLVVTGFSYQMAAANPGGGTYLIAGGAIIFGGIRFVKGLIQFSLR